MVTINVLKCLSITALTMSSPLVYKSLTPTVYAVV